MLLNMPQSRQLIKIAVSAGHDVFLYPSGKVQCGRVTYSGRRKADFKAHYDRIDEHLRRYRIRNRDVSGYQIMCVEDLYEYMAQKWQRTITIDKVRHLTEQ